MSNGFIEPALLGEGLTKVHAGLGEIGLRPQRVLKLADGGLRVAAAGEREAEAVARLDRAGAAAQRFAEERDRLGAAALGLEPAEVPAKMRSGEITSQSEQGADEDAGRTRLTFWYGGFRVRITCDESGNVVKTSRTSAANR